MKGDQYGVVLTPVILSSSTRYSYSDPGRVSSHESDISWLMTFLQREIEVKEQSNSYRESCHSDEIRDGPLKSEERKVSPGAVSALLTSSAVGMKRCGF